MLDNYFKAQNEVRRLRDILDRISTEAPGAIPDCNCGEGEACSRCEIRHLLDIYNGRVPDGPWRRPGTVLAKYKVSDITAERVAKQPDLRHEERL